MKPIYSVVWWRVNKILKRFINPRSRNLLTSSSRQLLSLPHHNELPCIKPHEMIRGLEDSLVFQRNRNSPPNNHFDDTLESLRINRKTGGKTGWKTAFLTNNKRLFTVFFHWVFSQNWWQTPGKNQYCPAILVLLKKWLCNGKGNTSGFHIVNNIVRA